MIPTLSSRPMAAHACPISPQQRAVHPKFWFRSLLLLLLGWGNSPQLPAVCTRVLPTHRRCHPSFSMEHPGAGTNDLFCTMEHFPPAIWLSNLTQNSGTETYCNR